MRFIKISWLRVLSLDKEQNWSVKLMLIVLGASLGKYKAPLQPDKELYPKEGQKGLVFY